MKAEPMVKILFIISILSLNNYLFAQKEGNIWYFGRYAGIDFNGVMPVPLSNGAIVQFEGCATICDNTGSLLFYTNGIKVWNSNHAIMSNGSGLMGHNSTTQSAIIVKQPGVGTIYYVFTVDAEAGPDGLRYSEIDMSLQGGLGDVNSNKNILIDTLMCEKITAIKHQNNTDFWIVTHLYGSDAFHSYLLTSSGLDTVPVVSNVGSVISGDVVYTIGYLKASLDGNRIAAANSFFYNLELFDFDNSTGLLSNPMTFVGFNAQGPYGVEFSPNGNLLYVSTDEWPGIVYQYNLLAGSFSAINNSRVVVGVGTTTMNGTGGALQLAPDYKIYQATFSSRYLGVINNPNKPGIGCSYNASGYHLAGELTHFGLPTCFNSIITNPGFTLSNICFGDSTRFYITCMLIDSVKWDFGDINSGINNVSQNFDPKHVFTDTGNFVVTLIKYFGGIPDTSVNALIISPRPTVYLGDDTTLCQGEILTLDATSPDASYHWSNYNPTPTINVGYPGTFWVEVTYRSGCSTSDTINVFYNQFPIIDLGNDTTLCQGDTLVLDVTTANAAYLWQDNSLNPNFSVTQQGNYSVEVMIGTCITADTININFDLSPSVDLGKNTTLCQGESMTLDITTPNATYLWQNNSTNPTFTIMQHGDYWATVTVNNCSTTDTINVELKDCEVIFNMPNVFTPNSDGVNDHFIPKEIKNINHVTITIYNRWGGGIFETNNITKGWDGRSNGKQCPDGTYYWIVNYKDLNGIENSKSGSVTLIR